jgi:hypothetical protein
VLFHHIYRYTSTSAAQTGVNPRQMLQSFGTMAATSILGYPIAAGFRVTRISLWAPPASQGSSATVAVQWGSSTTNPSNIEYSDTSMSTAQPAFLTCTPPKQSLAYDWQIDSTTNLLVLNVPIGGVVDLHVSLVLGDGVNTTASSSLVLVGATAGLMYYEPLDGRGGVYTPVSLIAN